MATGLVSELGVRFDELPDPLILLGRAASGARADSSDSVVLTRYWRAVFHARIHIALEANSNGGELDAAEAALGALGNEADRIELELLDLASRFTAPLRSKPELGPQFSALTARE